MASAVGTLAELYGKRLHMYRKEAGMTQAALGLAVYVVNTRIAQIERATGAKPSLDLSRRLDGALGSDGLFEELWPHVYREAYPTWSQAYMEAEQRAVKILTYVGSVVHGLLQTPEYARAMLSLQPGATAVQVEDRVVQRLARQERLIGRDAPRMRMVLDECVLWRPVGGHAVMRGQLAALLDAAQMPNVEIQVMPFDHGGYAAMGGSLNLLTLPDESSMVYTEGADTGTLFTDKDEMHPYEVAYDQLMAEALPSAKSLKMIRSAMEGTQDARVPTRSERRNLAKVVVQQSGGRGMRGGLRRLPGSGPRS